jgi:hypothetical protein
MTSTEAGTENNSSHPHQPNAFASISRSFDSASIVTVRRASQEEKQRSRRISTEHGMRIDSNDPQKEKALTPIHRRFDADSIATFLNVGFEEQQRGRSSSIDDGISIDSGDPITQISDRTAKSTKNSFTIRNETDPSSTSIDPIPLDPNADPSIEVTEAGMRSRFNDLQRSKTLSSIVASLDRRSNVTDPRSPQKQKQDRQRRPTEDGIAMDRSDSQE